MGRLDFEKQYRAERINARERRLAAFADSPAWAEQHLTPQSCAMPTPKQTEIDRLLRMQRDRRQRAEARVRHRKACAPLVAAVDAVLADLRRRFRTLHAAPAFGIVVADLVRQGLDADAIADYLGLQPADT